MVNLCYDILELLINLVYKVYSLYFDFLHKKTCPKARIEKRCINKSLKLYPFL